MSDLTLVCVRATALWHCVTGVTVSLCITRKKMGQTSYSHSTTVPYVPFKKRKKKLQIEVQIQRDGPR